MARFRAGEVPKSHGWPVGDATGAFGKVCARILAVLVAEFAVTGWVWGPCGGVDTDGEDEPEHLAGWEAIAGTGRENR